MESNDPYCVADVTLALRFALDANIGGLHLMKMQTKQNIMGFYNPIPPFKQEYDTPVLCIVYVLNASDPERPQERDIIHIDYFKDHQEVKIVIEPQGA